MKSLIGRKLSSRYRLDSIIGEGATGIVFKAVDVNTNEARAIKVLKKATRLRHIENTIRFKREVVTLSRLDNPGIIRMYDTGFSEDLYFMVMELVDGRSLATVLEKSGVMQLHQTLAIFQSISETLAYVHDNGIIHRDIKPGNIFIPTTSAVIKIGDFGLSRFINLLHPYERDTIDGTFCYMSPEQIGLLRYPIDYRTDLFSTGILMYRLLTGRLPFQGKDLNELFNQMLVFSPQKPSKYHPDIPETLDTIVLRLIDRDPVKRYQTASGLSHDLCEIERGRTPIRLSCDDPARHIVFHVRHIGRKRQMEVLQKAFSAASHGNGSVCLISAEAGSGKSRLCNEFSAWVIERGALCLSAVCMGREYQIPYQVFSDLIIQYISQMELMPEGVRRECYRKLRSGAGDLAGLLCKLTPLLGEILGELPEVVPLDVEKEQKRFAAVCAGIFRDLGDAVRPAVLLLDDLQWTDQGSMEILSDLWMGITNVPLLVVGCFRSNEVGPQHPLASCRSRACAAALPLVEPRLDALTKEEVGELLRALLRTEASWTGELAHLIRRKSGGNPLYTLEVVRQLVAREVLAWRSGQWKFNRELFGKIDIPEAMVDVILSRIAGIDESLTYLLSICAVVGKRFELDFLLSLPEVGAAEQVVAQLDTAAALELVEWEPHHNGGCVFLHDRIREAFVMRLNKLQKARIHTAIGEALEKRPGVSEYEMSFTLVHHFSRSGEWRRCLRYSLDAADQARQANAVSTAIHYFELSIQLLDANGLARTVEWSRAAEGLIELYPIIGAVDKANALAQTLLDHAKTPLNRARLHRILGINHTRISAFDQAHYHFASGLVLLGKRMPSSKTATFLGIAFQAVLHLLITLFKPLRIPSPRKVPSLQDQEITTLYQNAAKLYIVSDYIKHFFVTLALMNHTRRVHGFSKELADAISSYAMVFLALPLVRRSLHHHERSLAMKQAIGDKALMAESYYAIGFAHTICVNYEDALRYLSLAREICEEVGDYYQLVHVLNGIQNIHFMHTDTKNRLTVLKSLLSISELIGSHYGTSIACSGLGGHYFMVGDFGTARQFLERGVKESVDAKQWLVACICQCNLSRLALQEGNLKTACCHADIAAEIAGKHCLLRPVVAFRFIAMVEVLTAMFVARREEIVRNERKKMLDRLRREVHTMIRATRHWPLWRGEALRARADFHHAMGHTRKAEADFRAAISVLTATGRKYELAKCRYRFGKFLKERKLDAAAVSQLHSALEAFRQLGASHYVEDILAILGVPHETIDYRNVGDTERLISLLEVSRKVGAEHDLDTLLKDILSSAIVATGAAQGYFFLVRDTGEYELRTTYKVPPAMIPPIRFSQNILDQVCATGRTILTVDAAHQESFERFESVSADNMKSILCSPILRRGVVLGACYLDNPINSGVFGSRERELLEALMAQAAVCIENARAFEELQNRNRKLAEEGDRIKKRNNELQRLVQFHTSHIKSFGSVQLVTQDATMCELVEKAKRFAESHAPVLITGPSGSGKEIFAHLIHHSGRRKNGPFVKVNCSAIPETLFESEFFGYEKGAFTGATSSRKGKFELANSGTLMLDEIADLPLLQQVKLLRAIEERTITPVGGLSPRPVDVRIVAATNGDLRALLMQNCFRQDLYFRLSVLNLAIPSLSRRPDDIPVLASYFLSSIANSEGGREKHFDEAALIELRGYRFDGNVRQLRNLVHRLYVSIDKETITADDVQWLKNDPEPLDYKESMYTQSMHPTLSLDKTLPYHEVKESFERQYLTAQLKKHDSNLTQTAKALGLLPSALSRKLKSLGITISKTNH